MKYTFFIILLLLAACSGGQRERMEAELLRARKMNKVINISITTHSRIADTQTLV